LFFEEDIYEKYMTNKQRLQISDLTTFSSSLSAHPGHWRFTHLSSRLRHATTIQEVVGTVSLFIKSNSDNSNNQVFLKYFKPTKRSS